MRCALWPIVQCSATGRSRERSRYLVDFYRAFTGFAGFRLAGTPVNRSIPVEIARNSRGRQSMIRNLMTGCAAAALLVSGPALADNHEASGPALTAPEIQFERWTLDNGLQIIAIPDSSTGTVTTSMWYEVGSKLDPEGRSGFAHLFEHILSRKTRNMPYNMIYGLTADVGGTRNASNSPDRTNYYEIVPAEYLEAMLWTHRERMAFPVIDQEVFDKERDVVKEELRQRVLAPPYGRFQRFVLPESAYDISPYRRPGIGSIEDLDSATLDDARAFYQAYYGPDTATLIVAGNFIEKRHTGQQLPDSLLAEVIIIGLLHLLSPGLMEFLAKNLTPCELTRTSTTDQQLSAVC